MLILYDEDVTMWKELGYRTFIFDVDVYLLWLIPVPYTVLSNLATVQYGSQAFHSNIVEIKTERYFLKANKTRANLSHLNTNDTEVINNR